MPLLTACLLLTAAYVLLMAMYRAGWDAQPLFRPPADFRPATAISVVIPARNEAANIEPCLRSVLDQRYPEDLVEIIVVDDHSEDNTAAIVQAAGPRVRLISMRDLPPAPGTAFKKQALAAGIAAARGRLIVTSDADCIAGPAWLSQIAGLFEQSDAAMIIGPVAFTRSSGLLGLFQVIDFTSMQGITAAAHRLGLGGMANGANLAFSKADFEAVGGYSGIDHLASGDDFLLLFKMKQRFPERIAYLKSPEAVVRTAPQATWRSFLQQRIRWASKSGKYPDHRLTGILLLVYVFNAAIGALAMAGFAAPVCWKLALGMTVVKTASELVFLLPVWRFFRNGKGLEWFPLMQPLHIAYIILAGFLGLLGGYDWKGRSVR